MAIGPQNYRPRRSIFSFYKRKTLFFLLLMSCLFVGYRYLAVSSFKADEEPVINKSNQRVGTIEVRVDENGRIFVNEAQSKKRIYFRQDLDELIIPILDNAGINYDSVRITLTLPNGLADKAEYETLGVHGVGSVKAIKKDSNTIVYEADDVSEYATVSIIARLPKGSFKPDLVVILRRTFGNVQGSVWVVLAALMPSLTFLFMIAFLLYQLRRQKIDLPDRAISAPPMAIPPAIVGVLMHQKVRPREVAATLIDLAVRGDIVILDQERGFAFGKGKFDQRLLGFEKILLSKVFRKNLSTDHVEFERRINNHFYSRKISLVSAGVYALATRLGYFKSNPQQIHARYRLTGLGAFFLGLLGFIASLVLFDNPSYVILLWVGMMISALVVIFTSFNIPIRTILGQETLSNWFSFKKYLSSSDPIPYSNDLDDIFQRYLPYAIVLDCEAAWAKRFSEHNFSLPRWFLTEKNGLGLEDFCLSLFPIISYVSRSLVALREPGFE